MLRMRGLDGRPALASAVVIATLSNNATLGGRLVFRAGRPVFRDWCMPHDFTLVLIGRESGGVKEGGGDCDRICCGD